MTRPLRDLHWRCFRHLRWVAPLALLIGLAGYRGPVTGEIPEVLRQELPSTAVPSSQEEGDFDGRRILLEVFAVPPSPGALSSRRWVRLTLREPLREPDVIVYWATRASTYDQPPLGAQMLGVLDPRQPASFALPSQASFLSGRIVLFSLGQRVLIAQIPLPSAL